MDLGRYFAPLLLRQGDTIRLFVHNPDRSGPRTSSSLDSGSHSLQTAWMVQNDVLFRETASTLAISVIGKQALSYNTLISSSCPYILKISRLDCRLIRFYTNFGRKNRRGRGLSHIQNKPRYHQESMTAEPITVIAVPMEMKREAALALVLASLWSWSMSPSSSCELLSQVTSGGAPPTTAEKGKKSSWVLPTTYSCVPSWWLRCSTSMV